MLTKLIELIELIRAIDEYTFNAKHKTPNLSNTKPQTFQTLQTRNTERGRLRYHKIQLFLIQVCTCHFHRNGIAQLVASV